MRELEELGFEVLRTSGSHGAMDVLAWNEQGLRFIQCKTYIKRPGSYLPDIEKLLSLRLPPNATAELWVHQISKKGWQRQEILKESYLYLPPQRDTFDAPSALET